MLMLD
jgi:hypothetical protein